VGWCPGSINGKGVKKVKYKKGDKIYLVEEGVIGWEDEDWVDQAELEYSDIYEIVDVGYRGDELYAVYFEVPRGEYKGETWMFHPDHFAFVKISNEERIRMREEKQNAIRSTVSDS
jgi:hypothetical protein